MQLRATHATTKTYAKSNKHFSYDIALSLSCINPADKWGGFDPWWQIYRPIPASESQTAQTEALNTVLAALPQKIIARKRQQNIARYRCKFMLAIDNWAEELTNCRSWQTRRGFRGQISQEVSELNVLGVSRPPSVFNGEIKPVLSCSRGSLSSHSPRDCGDICQLCWHFR